MAPCGRSRPVGLFFFGRSTLRFHLEGKYEMLNREKDVGEQDSFNSENIFRSL
jgi:hypothetical protein